MLSQGLFTEGQRAQKDQLIARTGLRLFGQALMQARTRASATGAIGECPPYAQAPARPVDAGPDCPPGRWHTGCAGQQAAPRRSGDRSGAGAQSACLNFDCTRTTASVAGRTGLRVVDAGNCVAPGDTDGIATATQTMPIGVQFAVPQGRMQGIHASASAAPLVATG